MQYDELPMTLASIVERPVGRPAPERAKRLRWKMEPRKTGLRAVAAGPRSSWLTDGQTRYACVSSLGRSAARWYWVAGWGSQVPHRNTASEGVPLSLDEAKAAAMAYVREHLKTPNVSIQQNPTALLK